MSDQLISLQKMTEREQEEQMALTQSVLQDGEQKSSDKLMEVIRSLKSLFCVSLSCFYVGLLKHSLSV